MSPTLWRAAELVKWRAAISLALLTAAGPVGWAIADRLESQNQFCGSCHLDPESRLHAEKLAGFSVLPAASLAAAHRQAEPDFRCIECHGGVSWLNRFRVKSVALRDALRYLIGRFSEPLIMRHPLWDEDCAQCHGSFRAERDDAFHAIPVHNADLRYRCVDCHLAHESGAPPELGFLDRATVLPVCRQCHEEF